MLQDPTSGRRSEARYRPRPSGIAIGAMAETLGLRALDGSIAPPWLSGEPIGHEARSAVVAALAPALVAAGLRLVPAFSGGPLGSSPSAPKGFELDEAEVVGDVILHACDAWEALRDALDREALRVPADDGPWLVFTLLRLVAIDVAIRGAAAGLLARARHEGAVWSPSRAFEALVARACAALERPEQPVDERCELGEALEAGLLRVLEQAEHALATAAAPVRTGLLELVRRGSRASAAPWLVERLRWAESDPLWAADLRVACESWSERLLQCARRLAGAPEPELVPPRAFEPDLSPAAPKAFFGGRVSSSPAAPKAFFGGRVSSSPAAPKALRVESLWIAQADHIREAMPPERRAGRDRAFVLPVDDHPPERARSLERELLDAVDELDGTLEHGRRALQLAPDDPGLLVSVGALLAERACERRQLGWEHHVDVALALLRRATRIEPRWDRPWVEIAIVLADVGAWARMRTWVQGIPADVPVTPRLLRLRAMLPGMARASA